MKYHLLLLVFAAALLVGCNKEQQQLRDSIQSLEAVIEETPDQNKVVELERSYIKYADQHGGDQEMAGRYLYRAAGINVRVQNYQKAADLLERAVKDCPKSSATPNSVLLLADLYDRNLRKEDKAKEYYLYFKENFPDHEGMAKAELYFKPIKERLEIQIAEQEKLRYNDDKTLNQQAANELRRLYNVYINQVKDDPAGVTKMLYKTAEIHLESNNPKAAKLTLERILNNKENKILVPESQLMMADVMDNDLNQMKEAKEYAELFIKENPEHPRLEEAKFYLKPIRERLDIQIKKLEDEIFAKDKNVRINRRLAGQLIRKYAAFGREFPKDKKTPEYLYKAGEISRSISDFPQALDFWDTIYEKYKSYEKAPQALFLQGFLYENDFQDMDKAKEKYELFMKKYPKHELADDVKFSLDNLGKSPEEIIKSFEDKKANSK